jgi:hypothetical protein
MPAHVQQCLANGFVGGRTAGSSGGFPPSAHLSSGIGGFAGRAAEDPRFYVKRLPLSPGLQGTDEALAGRR